jgi:DNA polymerase III alpha subunit
MERAEPPDVNLDIEHDRREEIQHVYCKYGRSRATRGGTGASHPRTRRPG